MSICKNKLTIWEIASFIYMLIIGTLWHFLYTFSHENSIISFIAPVSESTWEHLKMIFFPMLLFSIIEFFFTRETVNAASFFYAKLIGIISGMVTMIVSFYTYVGILGGNNLPCDIIIFILSVIVAHYFFHREIKKDKTRNGSYVLIAYLLILSLFIYFTKLPPNIGLFANPK